MASLKSIAKKLQLFIDDLGYAGLVDEIALPDVTEVTEEHIAAGMIGKRKIGLHELEAMEASITSASILPAFITQLGQSKKWKLDTALEDTSGYVKAEKIILIGEVHKVSDGTRKAGESAKSTYTMDVHHYERYIDGRELIYIDIDTNIWRIDGVDQIADIIAAINA